MNMGADELYALADHIVKCYNWRYVPQDQREDITHEVITGILEKLPLVDQLKNPDAYLFKAGYRKGYNFIMRHILPWKAAIATNIIPDDEPVGESIEELVDGEILSEAMVYHDDRGWLTQFLGIGGRQLSVAEIADTNGCSRAYVYVYLADTIGELRESYSSN